MRQARVGREFYAGQELSQCSFSCCRSVLMHELVAPILWQLAMHGNPSPSENGNHGASEGSRLTSGNCWPAR